MPESSPEITRVRENTPWLHRFKEVLQPGRRVLDLGCGTGDDAVELASYGCRVTALDSDIQRVMQVPTDSTSSRLVGDLAGGLPFLDGSFDCVASSLSLHYFTMGNTVQAVEDISRVLRREGWLICRVNAAGDVNFGYRNGEEVEHSVFRQPDGRLKRFFDEPMLRRFLEPCFRLEQIGSRAILQGGVTKQTLECLGQKR
jgi:ubiquinone/menaquinone biosynthesis C-methylase UbiE